MRPRHRGNPTRWLLPYSALALVGLSACGGGGGSSSATPVVSATTYTIGGAVAGLAGTGLVLQDNGGNNLSVGASGAFTFTTAIASGNAYGVTVLTQPSSPAQTCAVSAGSGTVASANITSVQVTCTTNPVSNVVALTVNAGPAAAQGGTFNVAYTSVTLCRPGTKTCATITNVQVDTGSEGLRIMASALAAAGLTLTAMADPNNATNTIAECVPFADGYTWGALATADVSMGGELASAASINIIDDNSSYAPAAPSSCTSNGMSLNSVVDLGANGELGVGVFDQDCGPSCTNCNVGGTCNNNNDFYYSCGSAASSCTFTPLALTSQVRNPVALFATDNNGVILQLPAVAASGATTATGSLIFGIGTQSNNALGSATVLTADDAGNVITTFNGQRLSGGFIDSGSNAFYFPDSAIPTCSDAKDFYCPTSTLPLTATNQGQNGNTSPVSFQIANLDNISETVYAIADVGGPTVSITGLGSSYFDWGLPFMYGRSVYTAIDGKVAGSATGPYYAY